MNWLGRLVLLLVAFVVLTLASIYFLLPTERIVRIATDQARQATGRTLTVTGKVTPTFFPVIGVSTGPVGLSNADWAKAPEMITADHAEIGVEILPLLSGQIRVSRLKLVDPKIDLEIGKDGVPNWEFKATEAKAGEAPQTVPATSPAAGDTKEPPEFLRTFSLNHAEIVNGAISYTDHRSGQSYALAALNLTAAFPGLYDPFTAEGDASWNDSPVALKLTLDSPGAALRGGRANVDMTAMLGGAEVSYTGAATAPLDGSTTDLDGAWGVKADDPAALAQILGGATPPAALTGLKAVSLDGDIAVSPNRLRFKGAGSMTRDGRQLSVRLSSNGGDDWLRKGRFNFSIDADAQDFVSIGLRGDGVLGAAMASALGKDFGDGAPASIDAKLDLSTPKPVEAAAWAGVTAPPRLGEFSRIAATFDTRASEASLDMHVYLEGDRKGARAVIEGDVTGGKDWTTGGDLAYQAKASAGDLFTFSSKGSAAVTGKRGAHGALKFDSPSLGKLADWAGMPLEGPEAATGAASLSGDFRADPAGLSLTGADLALGATKVKGDLSADLPANGAPAAIRAKLTAGKLDLRPYLGGETKGGGGASAAAPAPAAQEGWSTEPIDFAPLRLVNADVALSASSVVLPQTELGASSVAAVLKGGQLKLDIKELSAFQGQITGAATASADKKTGTLALKISGVQLRPLMKALGQPDRIEGTGALDADLTAQGGSLQAMMDRLAGSGSIDFRDGAIIGVNLAAMVRNVTGAFDPGAGETQSTDFSSITGTFKIDGGVLTNSDLVFLGPLLRVTGAGAVGIGARNVNYRLTPKAVATIKGQGGPADVSGLAFPLVISGPWSKPKIAPDLGGAIEGLIKNPEGAKQQIDSVIEGAKGLLKPKAPETGTTGDGSSGATGDTSGGTTPENPAEKLLKGLFGK